MEDKIVQKATVTVLNAIYEADFQGFSYGPSPREGPARRVRCTGEGSHQGPKVNWILDADIKGFFDAISKEWLVRFLEHRIGDKRILRLVLIWLKAGVLEDGVWSESESGTPQGAVVSPLLATALLHYAFDLWAHKWRGHEAKGKVVFVRYADDIVAGFEDANDAKHFLEALTREAQAVCT